MTDSSVRLPMDNPVFERLKDIVQITTEDQEWFGMAEQALNTIYVLGEQPDAMCADILQDMAQRVYGQDHPLASAVDQNKKSVTPDAVVEPTAGNDDMNEEEDQRVKDSSSQPQSSVPPSSPARKQPQMANAFELAQLLFVAGHVSVRQLLHLELVEREYKRRKAEMDKKDGAKANNTEELDQVVGSVEDDVADLVAHSKEKELLYSPDALLSVFGPMAVAICSQPKVYKVCLILFIAELLKNR